MCCPSRENNASVRLQIIPLLLSMHLTKFIFLVIEIMPGLFTCLSVVCFVVETGPHPVAVVGLDL